MLAHLGRGQSMLLLTGIAGPSPGLAPQGQRDATLALRSIIWWRGCKCLHAVSVHVAYSW